MSKMNRLTKDERKLDDMRKQRILIELANILLQEQLISVDEKIRLEKEIEKGNA